MSKYNSKVEYHCIKIQFLKTNICSTAVLNSMLFQTVRINVQLIIFHKICADLSKCFKFGYCYKLLIKFSLFLSYFF